MHILVGWCTYDGNIVLLDNGLCLRHNARESAESGGTIYYKHCYGNKLFEQSLLQKFTQKVV